jgi:hypothetical protein
MDKSSEWGPKYWYVLHMMAFNYPLTPNKVTKKKYYETIMNWPLFLPHPEMGNKFSRLLDKYPVTPYLDSRASFIKWTHFIHNRINEGLGKPTYDYAQFIEDYTKPKAERGKTMGEWIRTNKNLLVVAILLIIIGVVYKLL